VVIDIIKKQVSIPTGWQSAICADICYASTVDSTRLTLGPGQVQPFTYYFYTDGHPSDGFVRVLFRNVNNTSNKVGQGFYGYTDVTGIPETSTEKSLSVFPNPFHVTTTLNLDKDFRQATLRIYNTLGSLVKEQNINGQSAAINREGLENGIYFIRVSDGEHEWMGKIIIE
jgi:hypothetical protein